MSTETVVVGCKLPNGLFMELGKVGTDSYQRHRLNGSNAQGALVVPGTNYGVTTIPKDFMDAWMKKHQWLPAVRKQLIFVVGDMASAQAQAMDNQKERTGLEPLNPEKPPEGIEVDKDHLQQGKRDVAQVTERLLSARAGA
jgi:hypothetical protein